MGVLADAIAVFKDVMQMRGDLDRLSRNVDTLSQIITDIDKRLVRMETLVEIASRRASAPARLPKK